jgi:hypothetical protein
VYATAIKRVDGQPKAGATVQILSQDGRWIAKGAYSPLSKIRVRVWSWSESEAIDHAFFKRKISTAIQHRQKWVRGTNAIRLIAGEADGLPGLIVDQYDRVIVCQFLSAGVEYWRDAIIGALQEQTRCTLMVERSDAAVRAREGLAEQSGILSGESFWSMSMGFSMELMCSGVIRPVFILISGIIAAWYLSSQEIAGCSICFATPADSLWRLCKEGQRASCRLIHLAMRWYWHSVK